MKRTLYTLILLFAALLVQAQQVERQMVVLEIATGTWCTYCPGAAMGADDLLANGCRVAVVENHNNDPFANQYSNARNNYYAVSGFPTAYFDGILSVVGGSHSNSMYPTYLPKYNQRIATPSSFTMDMQITNQGLSYTAVITVTKVAPSSATNIKLHFFITQSHISYNWQGQNHVNFVNRRMVPDQNGTPLSFANGDTEVVTLNFNLDPSWPLQDVEFVAGIQAGNKEFLQGIKRAAIDLNVDFSASTTMVGANGTVKFTNNTTGGYIGTPETYSWSFPGGTPSTSTQQNPTVTYTECGVHDVTLTVNRGGQIKTLTRQAYVQVGPIVNITSSPSDTSYWPFNPITLDATVDDPNATYLWEPGGETTPTITVTEAQYGLGEHTFTVTVNSMGCTVQKSHTVYFMGTVGRKDLASAGINVTPNPAHGRVDIYVAQPGQYQISVLDLSGREVLAAVQLQSDATGKLTLDIQNLVPGSYLLKAAGTHGVFSQKLIVK